MEHMHLVTTFELRQNPSKQLFTLQLEPQGLQLPDGSLIPWHRITAVNLNLVTGSTYNERHFSCRIYHAGKPLQIRANDGDAAETLIYKKFLIALHEALIAADAPTVFSTGMRSKAGYLSMLFGFGTAFIALEALLVYAIHQKGKLALGVLFMVLVAGLGYVFTSMIYKLLRPLVYNPGQIPGKVLP